MNWGLIGCGVIGERRINALPDGVKLVSCFDPNQERAKKISQITGAKILDSQDAVLNPNEISAVIIAAINSELAPVIEKALKKGIHVLVEKPAARHYSELESLKKYNSKIKIGFNHRFHPAFADLVSEIKSRPDDPVMFIRAQYGNGARLGFDKEWRSNVQLSGGGELLDQGVHVIDLASVIMPDLQVVSAYSKTHYWDMSVDDNTWAILKDRNDATFTFHVSSSEWKNEFRFEVYTRKRKYQWLGLGRSYGTEKLLIYTMKPEMGPPDFAEKVYPDEDLSWKKENTNFLNSIQKNEPIFGGLADADRCLRLVDQIYTISAKTQNSSKHPVWFNSTKNLS
jgi:predicted dehydrogenase